jgi:hypothetical protein
MTTKGPVYAYRKKSNPLGDDRFFVFDMEDADISDENWKEVAAREICFETRGVGTGDVWFMWRNSND